MKKTTDFIRLTDTSYAVVGKEILERKTGEITSAQIGLLYFSDNIWAFYPFPNLSIRERGLREISLFLKTLWKRK